MAQYGSEVQPNGPVQDMEQIDTIASTGGVHDRDTSPSAFTGGTGGAGLGGVAEPAAPDKASRP